MDRFATYRWTFGHSRIQVGSATQLLRASSPQRGEMFIAKALNPTIRAPAERNVSLVGGETGLCFAPLERGESFGGCAFYKHLAPLERRQNAQLIRYRQTLARPLTVFATNDN